MPPQADGSEHVRALRDPQPEPTVAVTTETAPEIDHPEGGRPPDEKEPVSGEISPFLRALLLALSAWHT
jgi:hypothetical protein